MESVSLIVLVGTAIGRKHHVVAAFAVFDASSFAFYESIRPHS
jgi:hypothetical protein